MVTTAGDESLLEASRSFAKDMQCSIPVVSFWLSRGAYDFFWGGLGFKA